MSASHPLTSRIAGRERDGRRKIGPRNSSRRAKRKRAVLTSGQEAGALEGKIDRAFAGAGDGVTGSGAEISARFERGIRPDPLLIQEEPKHRQEIVVGTNPGWTILKGPESVLHLLRPMPIPFDVGGGVSRRAIGCQFRFIQV